MKRIISLLICVCIIIGICPTNVTASEVHKKYFQVSVNGKVKSYECLWDNTDIYCSVEDLAEMTNYGWAQIEDDLELCLPIRLNYEHYMYIQKLLISSLY